jgi:DNA-binding XRE family transcriptional regulator/desulfoferrodoxin (superoxide reductase-like protein)
MDCQKVGKLIFDLRREQKLTQRQVADRLNLSDKTVSKWERGLGCPDISVLSQLADIFEVGVEQILSGEMHPNPADGGNMKRLRFYVCLACGNVLTGTGEADISCCGRKCAPLIARPADAAHQPEIEAVDDEYFLTFPHAMNKTHYLSFIVYLSWDRMLMVKLYPEQNAEVRFPKMGKGKLLFYCNQHGLLEAPLK